MIAHWFLAYFSKTKCALETFIMNTILRCIIGRISLFHKSFLLYDLICVNIQAYESQMICSESDVKSSVTASVFS